GRPAALGARPLRGRRPQRWSWAVLSDCVNDGAWLAVSLGGVPGGYACVVVDDLCDGEYVTECALQLVGVGFDGGERVIRALGFGHVERHVHDEWPVIGLPRAEKRSRP